MTRNIGLAILLTVTIHSFCLGQSTSGRKAIIERDTSFTFPSWHLQRFRVLDNEIKRLQATTIEAEIQRLSDEKDVILTSFLASRLEISFIIPRSIQLLDGVVKMKVIVSTTVQSAENKSIDSTKLYKRNP